MTAVVQLSKPIVKNIYEALQQYKIEEVIKFSKLLTL